MNKIIVVIPTSLNRVSLLLRTVGSVLSQTRPADHILISCDSDEVKTKAFSGLCKERFSNPSIQIVTNLSNQGLSENINNAINMLAEFDGRKTIISLLDDDDYWKSDYLFHVEKKFQHGSTFVASAYAYVNEPPTSPRHPPQEIKHELF